MIIIQALILSAIASISFMDDKNLINKEVSVVNHGLIEIVEYKYKTNKGNCIRYKTTIRNTKKGALPTNVIDRIICD